MNRADIAARTFENDYNCAQAVFSTFAEEMGINKDIALKIACPFGGGMGKLQNTCGAVIGAFLVLGLEYGKGLDGNDDKKAKTYDLVNKFVSDFEAKNKSIKCLDLLGYDMKTEEGKNQIEEKDLYNTVCTNLVRDAVIITEQLLNDKS